MVEKLTIDDIARIAGVSKATVSRVLNHKPDVAPATRELVLRIMDEQGFVPSITASGLAGGRSLLIGVLVPSFTWPFVSDILRGIAEAIRETSYELVLYSFNDRIRENDKSNVIDHILATKLTAGLLSIFPGQAAHHVAKLHKNNFPVVMIDDQELPAAIPWVGTDNQVGAYNAVRHLIRLGHKRIAHIQGPMQWLCSRERRQGYCDALEESGLCLDPELIQEGDFLQQTGYIAARKFFSLPPDRRPTAIFASSDLMAYGVSSAAEEFGLQIPQDVALVGFDDITSSAHVRPALTTVRQPFHEMGQCSMELLLSMLDSLRFPTPGFTSWNSGAASGTPGTMPPFHAGDSEPIRVYLATTLIVRASCGAPNQLSIPL